MNRAFATLCTVALAAGIAAGCGASDDIGSATDSIPSADTAITTTTTTTTAATTTTTTDTADTADTAKPGATTMTVITGELAYRERIAMLPGGTATITLLDTSLQDVAADVIAETTIDLDGQQVPISFELTADTANLDTRGTYSLRATITGREGRLDWTTDTANVVDITQTDVDLGTLTLVRVSSEPESDTTASPLEGVWNVTDVDGTPVLADAPVTIVFGKDGTLSGTGGCNSYSTTYETTDENLSVATEIVTTLMACVPDVAAQESAFLAVIGDIARFAIGDDGTLTLTADTGSTIVATR